MFFQNLNYITMVVATIAGMVVGFIWYAPFAFGKVWLRLKEQNGNETQREKENKPTWPIYLLSGLGTLASAFALSVIFNSIIIVGIWGILIAAFVVWIGFFVPVKLSDFIYGGESPVLFLISAGHYLLAIIIMAFIIAFFG